MEKERSESRGGTDAPAERHASETQHERDRLRRIVEALTEVVALEQPVEMLLERIVDAAMRMTRADGAVVELVEGDEMEYVAATGSIRPFQGMRLERGASLSGMCVTRGRLQYARDTETDPRVDRTACRRIGARSMLLVPLCHLGGPIGVLKVVASRPAAFDTVDEYALRLSAGLIGNAIGRQLVIGENERLLAQRSEALNEAMTILAASPTALVVHDLDGTVRYWNPAAERLLGWSEAEAVGRRMPQLREGDLPQFLALNERIAREGTAASLVVSQRRRDGSPLDLRVSGAPLHGPDGRITGIVRALEDISEHRAHADQLRAAADRLRTIIDQSRDAFIGMDARGRVIEWNASAERLFGWSRQEALLRPLDELVVPPQDREAHRRGLQHYLATGEGPFLGRCVEVVARCKDGSSVPVELSINAAKAGGQPVFDAFLRGAGDRHGRIEPLERQASRDVLTRLPNRDTFEHGLREALRREAPGQVAVVLLNLDGFRAINDLYGRAAGDAALQTLADRLREAVRARDTVARVGGDEFGVLVVGLRDAAHDVRRVTDKLLAALDAPVPLRSHEVPLSASLGAAVHESATDTSEGLLHRAGAALRAARSGGGGQVRVHLDGRIGA